jgi:TRAP-type transport system periplasmic protein
VKMRKDRGKLRPAVAALAALALVLVACGDDGATDTGAGDDTTDATDTTDDATDDDAAATGDFSDAPDVEVVFGHPFPDQHHLLVNVLQPWMDDVTERTDGTVTFDVQSGGALSGPPDAYEHPAAGVTDMGWALQGYTPGRFPWSQVVELPFLFESAVQGTEAFWDLYDEYQPLQDEYDDTQVLALWTHDVGDLFTVSRPVETAGDLSGLSIRTPAPMQNALVETLGGSAVGMPAPELYDSLDRGVIDGLLIGHSGVPTFGLDEVLGHVTRGNFFVGGMFLVMNPATWETLSPDQQAVFEETAFRNLSVALAEDMDEVGGQAVSQFEEWGFDIHELSEADLDEWRDATAEVPQQWIDSMDDPETAQQMYDMVQDRAGVS